MSGGILKNNSFNPKHTISDVASLAEVSTATVSRIINNLGGVSPALETRVREAIEKLNYKPNKLAELSG